jgi:tryptophan-rich sensory protein
LLLTLMMSCLSCLILAQSVLNWIGNNISCPKTNCPGVASNVVWTVLRITHVAALRKGPQESFVLSSLF